MGSLPTSFDTLPREWSKWSRFTCFARRSLYTWAAGWLGRVWVSGRSRSLIEAHVAFRRSLDRAVCRFMLAARIRRAA